ncbi:hypothetical protein Goari_011734 [Gossypium aridum]|uniref:Uncharacterized protein n=1 Tax=Gossypium aridum TaxID=34290 RepID=A0A7J8WYQ2_GOSAI|nr:hypothetical protein [Gossypium aridum]
MLEKVLPRDMLKAKPNLELKIKTLVIRKPNNLDIEVSLIMINLLSSTQKIKSLGKMLKQLLILLKK